MAGQGPVSHHSAVDDALGTDVAIAACSHLAVPDSREGKHGGEPRARHSFSQLHILDGLSFISNYPKMH